MGSISSLQSSISLTSQVFLQMGFCDVNELVFCCILNTGLSYDCHWMVKQCCRSLKLLLAGKTPSGVKST